MIYWVALLVLREVVLCHLLKKPFAGPNHLVSNLDYLEKIVEKMINWLLQNALSPVWFQVK